MRVVRVGIGIVLALLLAPGIAGFGRGKPAGRGPGEMPGGELRILGPDRRQIGACPLKHTDVEASIAGYVGRVRVRQTFHNPLDRTIEAVYVFPLPQDSAVDDMVMIVGQRRIVGKIKPREEARKTYERAKAAGHVASLLDQERPNIFTQSVANIEPGAEVVIEIRYVETLKYEEGVFEWVFPTVVGPRYMPGYAVGKQGTGWAPDTSRVPDASRISPPVPPPPVRVGHEISLTVTIDAGMELSDVRSALHAVSVERKGPTRAVVTLQQQSEIPNRDFILHYRTATDRIGDAFFVHQDRRGAYFTLVLQPPQRLAPAEARPKEMVFVIDRSGSMQGFPIEKAKETMRRCVEGMNPRDTFNLISFSNDLDRFFPTPQPNTPANRRKALDYVASLQGNGGTEMLPAIEAALERPADPHRVRIVCFMSDGYVGNDFEILDAVRKHAGTTRVFAFGIGNSVNRFLLDGMAHAGRGEVEYVTLERQGSAAAERFWKRIQSPVLTDIHIDWGGLPVSDVYPRQIPDLFSSKPLMIHGRLKAPAAGTITLRGNTGRGAFERKVRITPPEAPQEHDVLASLWARAKVKDLMMQDLAGLQSGHISDDLKQQITALGIEYRLMTQFTSFVAVEEKIITRGGPPDKVPVPVEMPEGVSHKGVFGTNGTLIAQARAGDPLIRVAAPADAQQVVALLPGGEIKRLAYDRDTGQWLARFDIPTYAAEGEYRVTVIVVLKDGARQVLTLRYRVDTTPPAGTGRAGLLKGGAGETETMLRLDLAAGEDTARVAALLPWGERVELKPSPEEPNHFTALVPIPPGHRDAAQAVTFVLTDRAHNRTAITLALCDVAPF